MRDGVLVSEQRLIAEVLVFLHANEVVHRVKAQRSLALPEEYEHLVTRKVELVSDPSTFSSRIVEVVPASLMEHFDIAYFAFDVDGQVNIGGTFRAPHVTTVKDYSRDPVTNNREFMPRCCFVGLPATRACHAKNLQYSGSLRPIEQPLSNLAESQRGEVFLSPKGWA